MIDKEDCLERTKSSWLKRIVDYEDLREEKEYQRLERERTEDNVIKRVDAYEEHINEINTKLDAILFALNTIMHSETNRSGSNSHEKDKLDKCIEKDKNEPKKANKRGRPKKVKGE